jgi:hypothetical protein
VKMVANQHEDGCSVTPLAATAKRKCERLCTLPPAILDLKDDVPMAEDNTNPSEPIKPFPAEKMDAYQISAAHHSTETRSDSRRTAFSLAYRRSKVKHTRGFCFLYFSSRLSHQRTAIQAGQLPGSR